MALVICINIYASRPQTYQLSSTSVVITNPEMLKDWMPDRVYDTTVHYLARYVATHNLAKNITIAATPTAYDDGTLFFPIIIGHASINSESDPPGVSVKTYDYGGGILSTSVSVNGNLQAYSAATNIYNTQFTGFNALTDNGVGGELAYNIQRALMYDFPHVNSFTLTGPIHQVATNNNQVISLTVDVGSVPYTITATTSDLSNAKLIITDHNGKRVFTTKTEDIPL